MDEYLMEELCSTQNLENFSSKVTSMYQNPLRYQTAEEFPYVFVADEAFALDVHIMKPYSHKFLDDAGQEFNKRLSRARVVV
jgi:hypothetical protein